VNNCEYTVIVAKLDWLTNKKELGRRNRGSDGRIHADLVRKMKNIEISETHIS
jgi:hypothetical protein